MSKEYFEVKIREREQNRKLIKKELTQEVDIAEATDGLKITEN